MSINRKPVPVRLDAGELGLYLLALGLWLNRSLAIAGLLLVCWQSWGERERLWNNRATRRLIQWLAVWTLSLLLSLGAGWFYAETPMDAHLESAGRYWLLALFPLVGLQLKGEDRRFILVCTFAVLGFVAGRVEHPDVSLLASSDPWSLKQRVGLGLAPIAMGFYAGFCAVVTLVFTPRALSLMTRPWQRAVVFMALMIIAAFLLQCMVISLSRGAWLATLLALAVLIVFFLRRAQRSQGLLMLGAVALILAVIGWFNQHAIVDRVGHELGVVQQVLDGDLAEVTAGEGAGVKHSLGARVVMHQYAWDLWLQRPWLGGGPAAAQTAMRTADIEDLRYYNDFHNVLLNVLVSFGLIGLIAMSAPMLYLAGRMLQAVRGGVLAIDVLALLTCAALMILVSVLFNFRVLNFDWRGWFLLMAGAAVGYLLDRGRD